MLVGFIGKHNREDENIIEKHLNPDIVWSVSFVNNEITRIDYGQGFLEVFYAFEPLNIVIEKINSANIITINV